jgi:hypothetical protein
MLLDVWTASATVDKLEPQIKARSNALGLTPPSVLYIDNRRPVNATMFSLDKKVPGYPCAIGRATIARFGASE